MYFLNNRKKKIVFGWNAKCACNHVKIIFNYYSDNRRLHPHGAIHSGTQNPLPPNHDHYKIVMFIRDPFRRLVSAYIEKYCKREANKDYALLPYEKKRTFRKFVDEFYKQFNEYKKQGHSRFQSINYHHFAPQLDRPYKPCNVEKMFDIRGIDYNYLNKLFNKEIPNEIIERKALHYVDYKDTKKYVYDTDYPEYVSTNWKKDNTANDWSKQKNDNVPTYEYFYDEDIKNKVAEIYKQDLDFFKENGFDFCEELKVNK